MKTLKIKIRALSTYHPHTDGQTEIMNKEIEEKQRNFVNHNKKDWDQYIVDVEVAYSRSPKAISTLSPFFLNYGFEPATVPADSQFVTASKAAAVSEWGPALKVAQDTATKAICPVQ